jgi:hypothetical protein
MMCSSRAYNNQRPGWIYYWSNLDFLVDLKIIDQVNIKNVLTIFIFTGFKYK